MTNVSVGDQLILLKITVKCVVVYTIYIPKRRSWVMKKCDGHLVATYPKPLGMVSHIANSADNISVADRSAPMLIFTQ
jgi:hypothetical protein